MAANSVRARVHPGPELAISRRTVRVGISRYLPGSGFSPNLICDFSVRQRFPKLCPDLFGYSGLPE